MFQPHSQGPAPQRQSPYSVPQPGQPPVNVLMPPPQQVSPFGMPPVQQPMQPLGQVPPVGQLQPAVIDGAPKPDNHVFGAIALGYPDKPWSCPACTYENMADRLECTMCESDRPPLNIAAANAHNRGDAFLFGRSWGLEKTPSTAGAELTGQPSVQSLPSMRSESVREHKDQEPAGSGQDLMSVACLSQEQFTMLLSIGLTAYQIFRITMACLLSIFVPQLCVAEPDNPNPQMQIDHDCSIEENFQELDQFNVFVTVWNFITLFIALVHLYSVFTREKALVDLLDEDPTVTNDFLVRKDRRGRSPIELYPAIGEEVRRKNFHTYITGSFLLILFLVNIVVSGILVIHFFYAGFRTITTYLTNITLIINVLVSQWNQAKEGHNTGIMYSMYKSDPAVYNNIDRKLRRDPRYFIPRQKISAQDTKIEMGNAVVKLK